MISLSIILKAIFFFSLLIPIVTILFYGLVLLYYNKIKNKKILDVGEKKVQNITIIIPTHNEERIIQKRIENIFQTQYPLEKMKVIFVDDSTDSTPDIIQKYIEKKDNFKLIKFDERMGYSYSVHAGIQNSDTEIIVLNEAGSFPRSDALTRLVNRFEDPDIGAVTGKSELIDTNERIAKIESLYLRVINFIREAESQMDSTFYIKGEATAYRREPVSDLEAIPKAGSIDTSMAFQVRKKGYKCVYDSGVVFHEHAPSDSTGYIKQKTVRAANLHRNILIFNEMLFNRKYGKFGLLTLPFHFLALFVFPLLSVSAFFSLITGLFVDPNFFIPIAIFSFFIFVLLMLVSSKFVLLLLEIEISLLKAMYQIFISKEGHDKIQRVESTRRVI